MDDEVRRFLRYVMPGLVYGVETLLFLYIVMPGFTVCIIENFHDKEGLGAIVGVFLASGGLGYIFAAVHHWVHWHLPLDGKLKAREEEESNSLALWYSLLNEKHKLGTAGIEHLRSQAHALGTARIASCFALITTIIVLHWLHGTINISCWPIFGMLILSGCIIWIFHESYRRVNGFTENAFNKTLKVLGTEHVPLPSESPH